MPRFYLDDTKPYVERFGSCCDAVFSTARLAVEDTFTFTERYEMERCTVPVRLEEPIDWDHIPFGDEEWCFGLNRHTFLLNLAKAFAFTGDEVYRSAWVRLFEDFFKRNPLVPGVNDRLSWRSLECGIRIENYIRSLEFFRDYGPLEASVMDDIREFFAVHVSWLKSCHTAFHRVSNWGVIQDHGLFLASLYLGDMEGVDLALSRLDEEMSLQSLQDGSHWEQSTMYQAEVLHAALDTILVADRNGIAVPASLRESTHRLATGLAHFLRPDGKCFLYGDSDEIDMRDLVLTSAVVFSDSELAIFGKGGDDADFYSSFPLDVEIPGSSCAYDRSWFFSDSGNALVAIGSDSMLRFHCGFYGSGHGHFDQLHFDLYHKGTCIFTDTGRGTYVDNELRHCLKGTFGHNTIVVNGSEMSEMVDSWQIEDFAEPLYCKASLDGPFKYVEGAHMGYSSLGVVVHRLVLTLEERFALIFDWLSGVVDGCSVDTLYHVDPSCTVELLDSDRVVVGSCASGSVSLTFVDDGGKTSVSSYPYARRYNEEGECTLVKRSFGGDFVGSSLLTAAVIGLNGCSCSVSRVPVVKPLSGRILGDDEAIGLSLSDGDDNYLVCYHPYELPGGGFLVEAGGCASYAKLFVRKNDETVRALRF